MKFNSLMLAATAFAITASGIAAAAPASAQGYYDRGQGYAYDQAYRDGYNRDGGDHQYYRDDRGYRDQRRYDDRRYYYQTRDRCRTGSTGTILGAIAGGLLGNSIAGRGDRTLGAVLGAGGGALAGRAIERDGRPGYCR